MLSPVSVCKYFRIPTRIIWFIDFQVHSVILPFLLKQSQQSRSIFKMHLDFLDCLGRGNPQFVTEEIWYDLTETSSFISEFGCTSLVTLRSLFYFLGNSGDCDQTTSFDLGLHFC